MGIHTQNNLQNQLKKLHGCALNILCKELEDIQFLIKHVRQYNEIDSHINQSDFRTRTPT